MSFFSDLMAGGVEGVAKGVGALAIDIRTAITGEAPMTSEQKASILERADALEAAGQQLQGQLSLAQIDTNKIQAASADPFSSRPRPFIMWICGVAFAYVSILEPVARFAAKVVWGYTGDFPVIDTTITMQILFGILGLGTLRSYDKKNAC